MMEQESSIRGIADKADEDRKLAYIRIEMRVLKRIRDTTISNREEQRDGVWKRRNVEIFWSGTHHI